MKISRKEIKDIFSSEVDFTVFIGLLVAIVIGVIIFLDGFFGFTRVFNLDLFNYDNVDTVQVIYNKEQLSMNTFFKEHYSSIDDNQYDSVTKLLKSSNSGVISVAGFGKIDNITQLENNYSFELLYPRNGTNFTKILVRVPITSMNKDIILEFKKGDIIEFKGDFHLMRVENDVDRVLYLSFSKISKRGEK